MTGLTGHGVIKKSLHLRIAGGNPPNFAITPNRATWGGILMKRTGASCNRTAIGHWSPQQTRGQIYADGGATTASCPTDACPTGD